MACINNFKNHSYGGALTCLRCGTADIHWQSLTPIKRAIARGKADRRSGRSVGQVPYNNRQKAEAWESGWLSEHKRLAVSV